MSDNPSGAPEEELVEIGTFSLVDPGGDPSKLRAAAEAWQARAAHLRALRGRLDGEVGRLRRGDWDGDARDAFETWWSEAADELDAAAGGFDEMAAELRKLADAIQEINHVVHEIYLEIGATIAIGVAVSVVSFGLGTAAAAARTTTLVQRAISWVNQLKALIATTRAAGVFAAFKATYLGAKVVRYGGLYARGVGYSAGATTLSKMAFNRTLNPFANWSGTDVRNLLLGGVTGVGVHKLAGAGRIGLWTNGHRYLSAAAQGFGSNVVNTVAFDAIDGKLSAGTPARALVGGTLGAGTSLGVAKWVAGTPGRMTLYRPEPPPGWASARGGLLLPSRQAPLIRPAPEHAQIIRVPLPSGTQRLPSGLVVPRTVAPRTDLSLPAPPPGTSGGYVPGSRPPPQHQSVARGFVPPVVSEARAQVEDELEKLPARPTWDVPPIEVTPPPPPLVPATP